ncbi:MAG: 3-deoxy-7-phosphoheptulonate synthase, partial [Acidimicrobiia bacterium]
MCQEATETDIAGVVARLESIGCDAHVSRGQFRTVIGAVGDREQVQTLPWEAMSGVEKAVPVLKSFRFVSRDFQSEDTVIRVGDAVFGGGSHFTAVAGPCAVEDRDQLMRTAEAVKAAGARMLRGDAFKPRTSPYA